MAVISNFNLSGKDIKSLNDEDIQQITVNRLPKEYQEVEWIKGKIYTGEFIEPKSTSQIYELYQMYETLTEILFTTSKGDWCTLRPFKQNSGTVVPRYWFGGNNGSANFNFLYLLNKRIKVEITLNGRTPGYTWPSSCRFYSVKDNILLTSVSTYSPAATVDNWYTQFAAGLPELVITANHKTYGFRKAGSKDLVPCYRKLDNVIGMYDIITHTFIAAEGTAEKGEDILTYNFANLNEVSTTADLLTLKNSVPEPIHSQEYEGNSSQISGTDVKYTCNGSETGDYYFTYDSISYQFTMPTVIDGDILYFDTTTLKLYLNNYNNEIILDTTITAVDELTFVSVDFPNTIHTEEIKDCSGESITAKESGSYFLPAEYQEVEYIESTGTQYIDTGYPINLNVATKIICLASFPIGNRDIFYGSGDNNYRRYNFGRTGSNSLNIAVGAWASNPIENDGNYHQYTLNINSNTSYSAFIDETQLTFGSYTLTAPGTNSFGIFVRRFDNGQFRDTGSSKCKFCQIYENNTLVRNFIPCYRKSDNEIGLYDTINNVFYTNSGTGTFLKGPDVGVTVLAIITASSTEVIYNGAIKLADDTVVDINMAKIPITLPSELESVEYIRTNNNYTGLSSLSVRYLDTGLPITDTSASWTITFSLEDLTKDCSIIGSTYFNTANDGRGIVSFYRSSTHKLMSYFRNSGVSTDLNDNKTHTLRIVNSSATLCYVYFDGIFIGYINTSNTIVQPVTNWIIGANGYYTSGTGFSQGDYKIYELIHRDVSQNITEHYIPCKLKAGQSYTGYKGSASATYSNEETGMYDIINKKFYVAYNDSYQFVTGASKSYYICDKLSIERSIDRPSVMYDKNVSKIDSYNGETISGAYISSTGGLDTGATVYYENLADDNYDLTETTIGKKLLALETIRGNTTVELENPSGLIYSNTDLKYWEQIKVYPDEYVDTANMLLWLDGIDNGGIGVHNSTTGTWVDLSGKGNDFVKPASKYADSVFDTNCYVGEWPAKRVLYRGTSIITDSSQFTVEVRFKKNTMRRYGWIFQCRSENANPTNSFQFFVTPQNSYCIDVYDSNANEVDAIPEGHKDDNQNTLTFSFDKGTLKDYINGTLINTFTNVQLGTLKSDYSIGTDYPWYNDDYLLPFNGNIYSIRIYNRALTDNEVSSNYLCDLKRFS